MNNAK